MDTTSTTSRLLSASDLVEEQHLAIDRLYDYDETLLIAGLGFGKAIVGLTAVQALIHDGALNRVLVLAPLQVATLTWAPESQKWGHITEPVAIACGDEKRRRQAVESGARIVVTNFENVEWMIKKYGSLFDGLLVDEVSKLKSAGGATVKALRRWAPKLAWRAGMSATPVAECADDIYAQALILDNGKALGTRKSQFLNEYFEKADFMGYSWAPREGSIEKIAEKLRGLVFTAADTDYKASLPGVETIVLPVHMDPDGRQAYRSMSKKSVWQDVIAPNAGVRQGKLQQIAAGGLYKDEEKELAWSGFHKTSALAELFADLAEDDELPVIIVYTYLFERAWLTKMFPKAPIIGGASKITSIEVEAFNRGDIPVLLMHWRSGAHGLNLQGACHTMIHLTPLWSADGWAQTIGRIHRRGQTSKCKRYVLCSLDTVEDEMMLRVVGKGDDEASFMKALAT